MKSLIIIVAFLISFVVIDARYILPNNYMKNINKSIDNYCNKEAFSITKNNEIYDCLIKNNKYDNCKNINNFNDYIYIKYKCMQKKQNEITHGFLICLFVWIIIGLF